MAVEVELDADVLETDDGRLIIQGSWKIGSQRSQPFQWVSAESWKDVSDTLHCSGSFKAGAVVVPERAISLQLDKLSPPSSSQMSTCSSSRECATYQVKGLGENGLGKFALDGVLSVNVQGARKLTVRKRYYAPPSPRTHAEDEVKVDRVDREEEDQGLGCLASSGVVTRPGKRRFEEAFSAQEQARLRAQHWRRRQSMRKPVPQAQVNNVQLPKPKLLGVKRSRKMAFEACWEALMVPTGPYTVVRDIESLIKIRDINSGAVVPTEWIPVKGTSTIRHVVSQSIGSLPPGLYSFSVRVRSPSHPWLKSVSSNEESIFIAKSPCDLDSVSALVYKFPEQDVAVLSWKLEVVDQLPRTVPLSVQVTMETRDHSDWRCVRTMDVQVDNGSNNLVVFNLPKEGVLRFGVVAYICDSSGVVKGNPCYSGELECGAAQPHDCVICSDSLVFGHGSEIAVGSDPRDAKDAKDGKKENGAVNSQGKQEKGRLHPMSCVLPSCCSHMYHAGCLMKWAKKKPTCPLCCTKFSGVSSLCSTESQGLTHFSIPAARRALKVSCATGGDVDGSATIMSPRPVELSSAVWLQMLYFDEEEDALMDEIMSLAFLE